MHHTLVILAAGMSSRMKGSQAASALSMSDIEQANTHNKGLIGVCRRKRAFLDYLLYNVWKAGYRSVIIVTGESSEEIRSRYGARESGNEFHGLRISYALQHVPEGRRKPLGTADAVLQAMQQYPELQHVSFSVCNSDNLYSPRALTLVRSTDSPNALIGYDRDGLQFPLERIARFAVIVVDCDNQLLDIVEKPSVKDIGRYGDSTGIVRVSMNLFKFSGELIFPFLLDCPTNPRRQEKEIVTALSNMIRRYPKTTLAIPLKEHVPDLTKKRDIDVVRKHIAANFSGLDWTG